MIQSGPQRQKDKIRAEKLHNTLYLANMLFKANSSQLCAKVSPEASTLVKELRFEYSKETGAIGTIIHPSQACCLLHYSPLLKPIKPKRVNY